MNRQSIKAIRLGGAKPLTVKELPKLERLMASRSEAARANWRRVDEQLEQWRRSLIALATTSQSAQAPGQGVAQVSVLTIGAAAPAQGDQGGAASAAIASKIATLERRIMALEKALATAYAAIGDWAVLREPVTGSVYRLNWEESPEGVSELRIARDDQASPDLRVIQGFVRNPETGEQRLLYVGLNPDGEEELLLSHEAVGMPALPILGADGDYRLIEVGLNPDQEPELRIDGTIRTGLGDTIRSLKAWVQRAYARPWAYVRHRTTGDLYCIDVSLNPDGVPEITLRDVEDWETVPAEKPLLAGPDGFYELAVLPDDDGVLGLTLVPTDIDPTEWTLEYDGRRFRVVLDFNEEGINELYVEEVV